MSIFYYNFFYYYYLELPYYYCLIVKKTTFSVPTMNWKGTQFQVLDISSLSKNPQLLLLKPDTCYIEIILVFHGNSYYRFDHKEYQLRKSHPLKHWCKLKTTVAPRYIPTELQRERWFKTNFVHLIQTFAFYYSKNNVQQITRNTICFNLKISLSCQTLSKALDISKKHL